MNFRLKTKQGAPRELDFKSKVIQKTMKFWAAAPFMPSSHRFNISISHGHRFIWFRVAKVATRSTLQSLRDQGVVFEAEHPMSVRYPLNTYSSYFKFAFVRSPWDRLVSCWRNKIIDRHITPPEGVVRWNGLPDTQLKEMEDFEGFVEYVESLDIDNCDLHLRSQSRLIDLDNLDFLGRFESFAQDMNQLSEHLELRARELPKINQSEGREHYRSHYDASLVDRVHKIYRRDIQIFGYSFEN